MSTVFHSGMHPDADVLNAFMEGALPEHERSACLAHLAECAHCREVVSLAGQAMPVGAVAAAGKTGLWRRVFRPLPMLAAIAAAAVLGFSVGIYRMIKSAEPKLTVTASVNRPVETPPLPVTRVEPVQPATPRRAPAQRKLLPLRTPTVSAAPVPPLPSRAPVAVSPQAPVPSPAFAPRAAAVASPAASGVMGTVTDAAGAVVPNAQVQLKSDATGATFSSRANAGGGYSIAGLTPGKYDLSVTAPGFKTYVKPLVDVEPQEMARLDSVLEVGASAETVTVETASPLLKTESGAVSRDAAISINGLPTGADARRLGMPISVYTLPDKSTPVSFAVHGKTVVAADAAGAVFFSDNDGKSWRRVKGEWKGKVVRVLSPPADGEGHSDAVFEMITDPASTWLSADGRKWSLGSLR